MSTNKKKPVPNKTLEKFFAKPKLEIQKEIRQAFNERYENKRTIIACIGLSCASLAVINIFALFFKAHNFVPLLVIFTIILVCLVAFRKRNRTKLGDKSEEESSSRESKRNPLGNRPEETNEVRLEKKFEMYYPVLRSWLKWKKFVFFLSTSPFFVCTFWLFFLEFALLYVPSYDQWTLEDLLIGFSIIGQPYFITCIAIASYFLDKLRYFKKIHHRFLAYAERELAKIDENLLREYSSLKPNLTVIYESLEQWYKFYRHAQFESAEFNEILWYVQDLTFPYIRLVYFLEFFTELGVLLRTQCENQQKTTETYEKVIACLEEFQNTLSLSKKIKQEGVKKTHKNVSLLISIIALVFSGLALLK